MSGTLTEEAKNRARELGADLVGIAPIERFKNAPNRLKPADLLPSAKSVIVAGIHHPDACVELGGEPSPHDTGPYDVQCTAMNPMLDDLSFLMARFLEEKGYKTLPISASNIWRYKGYKDLKLDFAPDLVHRYAAVAAGLGEIGWSGLFLSPQFGPRQRVVSIITEAFLDPDPMYSGEVLCDKCMECVKHCPTDAFRKEVKKINKIEIGGKTFRFPDTNKWRCSWAENFALSLDLKIPERIDEKVILQTMEKYGRRAGEMGSCLKYCMVPDRRYYKIDYSSAPRRKKERFNISPDEIVSKIKEIADKNFVDVLAISKKENFKNNASVHPEYHLPDTNSVICAGIRLSPDNTDKGDVKNSISRRLNYVEFEIAHYLDIIGYSAITHTKIANNLAAQQLNIYQSDIFYITVLTSSKLPQLTWKKRKARRAKIEKGKLKKFCQEKGIDLAGFFSQKRFEKFKKSIGKIDSFSDENFYVEDKGFPFGPYVPQIQRIKSGLKTPEDWLPGAKSVIVLGLRYPDSSLDTAKITPAETTGPYAFVQYESLRLLGDIAMDVVKYLENAGFRAAMTYDLCGTSSFVNSPRGMLPDVRANRFSVVLSGLGYVGDNGAPLTKEFGLRQRFISVITDCPLSDDPLYNGEIACKKCSHPCIKGCPTKAIKEKRVSFSIEGKEFTFSEIDTIRCDWAKRYALEGKAGPSYYGIETNVPLPKGEISAERIASAASKVKWGVQKIFISICEECVRVCPAHRKDSIFF